MKSLFTICASILIGTVLATSSLAAIAADASGGAANSRYPNTGKVLEATDVMDMYTYIQVTGKTDKDKPVWLAASKVKLAKGDTIRYGGGAVMPNYYSKTLNKTFEEITFVDKVEVVK